MSDTEKEKDVSRFAVDGVVAEMVIEVEENQKSAFDDFKETNSPVKDTHSDHKDEDLNCDRSEVAEEQTDSLEIETKEDKENSIETKENEETSSETKENEKNSVENKEGLENSIDTIEDKENSVEMKEDKENSIEIIETMNDDKEQKQEINNDKKNNENVKSTQKNRRKRKTDLAMYRNESKEDDKSRYPGLKRHKVENDPKEKEIKEVSSNKLTKRPGRNKEPDAKITEKTGRNKEPDVKITEKTGRNKEPDAQTTEKTGRNKAPDTKIIEKIDTGKESVRSTRNKLTKNEDADAVPETTSKQDILRKLPFRKNRDAPDVPDLKPNVFWWNGVGKGEGVKLGDIPEIRQRVKGARSIRALYRVLFFQWPSSGREDIIKQILEFDGFPFDKSSYEFSKRQSLMKIMLDNTISHICATLDLKKGDKSTMIKNILDFLLRPYGKIDPAQDSSWQPVVVLERLNLDNKFLDQMSDDITARRSRRGFHLSKKAKESNVNVKPTPARTTRGSGIQLEVVETTEIKRSPEKLKEDPKAKKAKLTSSKPRGRPSLKSLAEDKSSTLKDSKEKDVIGVKDSKTKPRSPSRDSKTKAAPAPKDVKGKTSAGKDVKQSPDEKAKIAEKPSLKKAEFTKKRKFTKKKTTAVSSQKIIDKKSSDSDSRDDEYEIEMTVDSGPDLDDAETKDAFKSENTKPDDKEDVIKVEKQTKVPASIALSDSSETESAEETKFVQNCVRKASKTIRRRIGKPLKHFPKISDSIQQANFSALQRLHILLFGASDKAENLKSNILAFGGFPFLEGSDEWKQKHFLLSLLAQNNLREYLNLLCIEYSDDDQPAMINKLMRFLAAPSEDSFENKLNSVETEVVSSELIDKSPTPTPAKGKVIAKKKIKKKEIKKINSNARRKVLMSEEEARRLELSFAREQRAIAREMKAPPPIVKDFHRTNVVAPPSTSNTVAAPSISAIVSRPSTVQTPFPKPPTADPRQLNALLQTVYKRRALKAAGAVVSTPNKGERTKLGDIENIKFLIVTSHITDLFMLHRLIFMVEGTRQKIRKNILDFGGFGFNEDSEKYKQRMEYLKSLGHEASKRISFLLGLCPLQTNIPQQDLNELIMYFLMSPCKTKQVVPITEMPLYEEPHIIVKSTAHVEGPIYENASSISDVSSSKPVKPAVFTKPVKSAAGATSDKISTSTPLPGVRQKARKSFPSSLKASPVKKILLPPSQSPLNATPLGGKPQKMTLLNSVPAVPALSLQKPTVHSTTSNVTLVNTPSGIAVLNMPNSPVSSLIKVPVVNPGSKLQIMNQGSKVAVVDAVSKSPLTVSSNVSGQALQNQILIPQISNNVAVQPQQNIPAPLVPGSKMLVKSVPGFSSSSQEFLVQQQTPDGQQKKFKLIRLAPNHPLTSAVGKQQTVASPTVQKSVLLTNPSVSGNVPPGIVIMKSGSGFTPVQNLQNFLQTAPVKITMPASVTSSPVTSAPVKTTFSNILPKEGGVSTASVSSKSSSVLAKLASEDNPPTDEDLFSSIQEVILSSNFEDITLRNVIERVAAQFPQYDLTHRFNYMKECVKKIIIGT